MKRHQLTLAALYAAIVGLVATSPVLAQSVETEFLGTQQGFSHIAKTTVGGVTTIYISGQVGIDPETQAIGEDVYTQAVAAFKNVLLRVEEAGAEKTDIVKTTVFITDIDPERVQQAGRAQGEVLQLETPPASTWVGVTGLVFPSLLIEVEAIAVLAASE